MKPLITATYELLATSFHPSPFGGGILIGTEEKTGKSRRAQIGAAIATRAARTGETWRVAGSWVLDPNHGWQLDASAAMPLVPRGEGIIRWIATNQAIPGVGRATATRLWNELGPDVYRALRERDAHTLSRHVGALAASAIVTEFGLLSEEVDALEYFDRHGFDARTAIAAATLWGRGAIERVERDPYCLNLIEPWRRVDDRARRMGVGLDDERRLIAAVNEVMSRRYRGHERGFGGHTAGSRAQIVGAVRALLGNHAHLMAEPAFDLAVARGELLSVAGLWQGRGPYLMERAIEEAIHNRLNSSPPGANPMAAIREVEQELNLKLDNAQIDAVEAAVKYRFAVIDGAAGTGKSMVTRAIMRAVQMEGRSYVQVALSGRAAKRLREATGYPALTVHRFIKGVTNGAIRLSPGTLLIDEASMISTPDLWQMLSWALPETDVVLVGDPGQLPPIRAGNPIQAMVGTDSVPRVTLEQIHRQSGSSPIPVIAAAIRQGVLPSLPEFNVALPDEKGVFFLPSSASEVPARVIDVFASLVGAPAEEPDRDAIRKLHGAQVQILGMTLLGNAGVRAISDAIETRWMANQPAIPDWGLAEGSKILWTRNSYDHDTGALDHQGKPILVDIMNGSLGIVQRASPRGAIVLFDDEGSTRSEIRPSDFERISRGWAITVHKSQGSAFDTVIIPIVKSRLLDRQLIYTAITRARSRVILVGEMQLLANAISAPSRATARQQCLLAAEKK